jgi:hypothetical protein
MSGSAKDLAETLKNLEQKRKNREIDAKEFYVSLLNLLQGLIDTLNDETISEASIRKQIPLLLTFLKAQIKNLGERNS